MDTGGSVASIEPRSMDVQDIPMGMNEGAVMTDDISGLGMVSRHVSHVD